MPRECAGQSDELNDTAGVRATVVRDEGLRKYKHRLMCVLVKPVTILVRLTSCVV